MGVFLRRGGIGYVHREDQETPCDDEAETGGTHPQAKGPLGLPGARRGRKEPAEGVWPSDFDPVNMTGAS